ncbi:MAG TPA: hypothetical protein VJV79_01335 [Polyangiaceae bacterium]|nr:hypothetical protein [Polyangiaceae bacterium]
MTQAGPKPSLSLRGAGKPGAKKSSAPHFAKFADQLAREKPGIGTVVVVRHGSAFLAMQPDFEDIQLSPTGMGGTPATAVEDLLQQGHRAKALGYFVLQ